MDTVGTSSLCPHYRESLIVGDYFFQIFANLQIYYCLGFNSCRYYISGCPSCYNGVSARRELPLVDIETATWASDRGTRNRGREVNIFNPVTGMEIVIGSYIRLYCTHVYVIN